MTPDDMAEAIRDAVRLADLHAAARHRDEDNGPGTPTPSAPARRAAGPVSDRTAAPPPPGPLRRPGTILVPREHRPFGQG